MKVAIALPLILLLLGGAFLLGHKFGARPPAVATDGANMTQAPPQPPPGVAPRPVRIGGAADRPACDGAGQIAPIPAEGDPFHAVRAAPDPRALEIGRLMPGADVRLCERTPDGVWIGIVYKADDMPGDACGVSAPISTQQAYAGACLAGWVSRQSVQPVAG